MSDYVFLSFKFRNLETWLNLLLDHPLVRGLILIQMFACFVLISLMRNIRLPSVTSDIKNAGCNI